MLPRMQFGNPAFPFLATRPISSAALVRSKIWMALFSATVACVPGLFIAALFFVSPSFVEAAVQGVRSVGAPKAVMILLLAGVAPILVTWKALVENYWMGLAGRPWLINTLTFGFLAVFFCGTMFGLWVTINPEVQAFLWRLLPWVVSVILIAKLVAASLVVYGLLRLKLATRQGIAWMA